MKRPLPPISETVDELKEKMQSESHPLKRQRLHALYLVVSGQATSRQAVAQLLGVHRKTVGLWLATYEQADLHALRQVTPPPGAVPALNAPQQQALRAALAEPSGFASYQAVQAWIEETFGVAMAYQATHKLVRYKLGAKLKVARPTHQIKTRLP